MIRRDFLKNVGLIAAGVAITDPFAMAAEMIGASPADDAAEIFTPDGKIRVGIRDLKPSTNKQVTAIVIGAGDRGGTYARYAKRFPEHLKIVGVSDIQEHRRHRMGDAHDIPQEHRLGHYNEVFEHPKFADVVIISTPDDRHFEPCMKALAMGYDVLLEKPVAQTEKECRAILKQAKKYNRIVAVCHVLRYAPYFVALKKVVESGAIGELVSVQHMEPIRYEHMAHSYVRGKWRDSEATTPIILAKSCHDLDAPAGAPLRCTDGCPHEADCPYCAMDIYIKRKAHLGVFDLKNKKDDAEILEKLKTTDFGRCVYHCDNNQPDHYVAGMTF